LVASQLLEITIPENGKGYFADFAVNCNNTAARAIYQYLAAEISTGTRFERIGIENYSGTASYPWVNYQCEDCVYKDIDIPYSEGVSGTRAISVVVPYGGVAFKDCTMWGLHTIEAQLANFDNHVGGPINPSNAANSNQPIMNFFGGYLYDGPTDAGLGSSVSCIGSGGYGCNINAYGTVFIILNTANGITCSFPNGATCLLDDCSWVQSAATGTTFNLVADTGGQGAIVVRGGTFTKAGAGNATTVKLANTTGGNTVAVMPVLCKGVTSIGTSANVTAPGFPATASSAGQNFGVAVDAYILNGAGALTVYIDGELLPLIPALAMATLRVNPGSSIYVTYASGTPTWVWHAT